MGCLFPYSDTPNLQEVSKILRKQNIVSIPVTSVWDLHGPPDLYEGHGGRGSLFKASRSVSSTLFRRLASTESIARSRHSSLTRVLGDSDQFGTASQLGGVRNNTLTDIYVCGDGISDPVRNSQTATETTGDSSGLCKNRHRPNLHNRKRVLSLLGLLSAAADLIQLGRLHVRPLQWDLKLVWSQKRGS